MKLKLRSIIKKILLTYLTQAIILVTFLYLYRLIGIYLGPEGVGEYSLVKRVIGLISPLLLLGIGMGIPRNIAMSQDEKQRSAYMKTAWGVLIFTFIFVVVINMCKQFFARIFLGGANNTQLILPLSLLLAGFVLHSLVYSYFRGRLWVKTFNLLQIINIALVPLVIIVLFKDITISRLITLAGITTLVISFVFSLFFAREMFIQVGWGQLRKSAAELFRYSLPRIPSSFALSGFFSLGPILAAHFVSIEKVGYLSVSQRFLTIAGTAFAPLGIILLPKVSSMIIQKRNDEIKEHIHYLVGASIQFSIFASFQLFLFSDTIIHYWLGDEFLGAVDVMRIVSCTIFFYLFFRAVGSILDATKIRPINTINLFISLAVFLVSAGILLLVVTIFPVIISLSVAFSSGLVCLGVLSYISIRRIYPWKLGRDLKYFSVAVAINIVLAGIVVLFKSFIASKFLYVVGFEIFIGALYLFILWLLKMDWLRKFPEKILLRKDI